MNPLLHETFRPSVCSKASKSISKKQSLGKEEVEEDEVSVQLNKMVHGTRQAALEAAEGSGSCHPEAAVSHLWKAMVTVGGSWCLEKGK